MCVGVPRLIRTASVSKRTLSPGGPLAHARGADSIVALEHYTVLSRC